MKTTNHLTLLILCVWMMIFLTACTTPTSTKSPIPQPKVPAIDQTTTNSTPSIEELINKYQEQTPRQWGERVKGVKQRLKTNKKVIALTLDACGGPHGSAVDTKLIQYLQEQQIPATLFINRRWIQTNLTQFKALAKNPLFEIENHGTKHLPLSVNGRSIYGTSGTQNIQEVIKEIQNNDQFITSLTGKNPKFFRSGTAYYDEIAVQIAQDLGNIPVNFDIAGDAGATFSKQQVKQSLLQSTPGSIILLHMNKPKSDTAEGVIEAIPLLQQQGYRFVKLEAELLK